jgi:hypothetical protein
MEHLQREFSDGARMITEEASYVEMTEKVRRESRQFESRRSESPRYCEIDESTHTTITEEETSMSSAPSHYEYLYQARTATSQLYESVYQEIPEEEELVKPMDRLPDILGNTPPVDVQCSRSDYNDDETPRESPSAKMMMFASDTFRPASFFLDHSSQKGSSRRPSKAEEKAAAAAAAAATPNTPTLSKMKRPSTENVSSPGKQGQDQSKKHVRPASGLPPDKINLTYRSVYENETSSHSDTDNKTSAASTASLNRDTDGSSSAGGGAPYYVSELKSNAPDPRGRPESARSRTPSYVLDSDPAVPRTKSLEGLLGDGHAGARDSVRVVVTPSFGKNLSQPISAPSPTMSSYRSTPLPARGREPPPPPICQPATENTLISWQYDDDDENRWRESLRRASAEHKARSSPFVRRAVPAADPTRSFSVCGDPVDPNFFSRQNFLERGLPEGTPETPTRSGRPQASDPLPHAASFQNLSSAPVSVSGRRSVAASFAPEAPFSSGTSFPETGEARSTFQEGKFATTID